MKLYELVGGFVLLKEKLINVKLIKREMSDDLSLSFDIRRIFHYSQLDVISVVES